MGTGAVYIVIGDIVISDKRGGEVRSSPEPKAPADPPGQAGQMLRELSPMRHPLEAFLPGFPLMFWYRLPL